jgi:general stress protein 26
MKAISKDDALRQIYDKIQNIEYAMLTSIGDDGLLRSRPMNTVQADMDGRLWFFSVDHTEKTNEVSRNSQVNLAYSDVSNQTYVSVTGTASLVHDRVKMEKLWDPLLRQWFPQGVDTPGLALLCVEIEQAEFWDNSASKMVQLFNMAKAIFTGATQEGEHKEIRIKQI